MRWVISAGVVLSVVCLLLPTVSAAGPGRPTPTAASIASKLTPPAGATKASVVFWQTPPYNEKRVYNGSTHYFGSSCTGMSGSTSSHADANKSSGVVHIQAAAVLRGKCGSNSADIYSYAEVRFGSSSFTIANSGVYSVVFNWSLDSNASQTFVGVAVGAAQFSVYGFIWDATNRSPVQHSQNSSFVKLPGGTNASINLENHSLSLSTSGRLVVGHSYRLVAIAYVDAEIIIRTGSGHGVEKWNMAFNGEFGILSSMTVS